MKKILLAAMIVMCGVGCTSNPVPEQAVSDCIAAGRYPLYESIPGKTVFTCVDERYDITWGKD